MASLGKTDAIGTPRGGADMDNDVFLSASDIRNRGNDDAGFFDCRQRKDSLDSSRLGDAERIRFAFSRSEGESSAAFMLGTELGDFLSHSVHDDAGHIGRLLGWRSPFNVDAVRQARDQIAPFGIDCKVHRLQKNGNGFCSSLHRPAILNDHGNDALAAGYSCG